MRFQVLGSIDVVRADARVGIGGPQQRRLLGVLLIANGHHVTTDRLVDTLWPDGDAPEGASRSVVTYISRLRAAIGDGFVATHGSSYRLERDGSTFDVDEFEALVAEAESSLPDRAIECYDRALALWAGDPFGEFTGEWWARPESTRLVDRRAVAREESAGALIALGHHSRAVPDLQSLILEQPLRERPVSLLMQALVATGRQAEALRAFRSFRSQLAEQTGLDPSAALVALEREIAGSLATSVEHVGRPLRGYVIHEAIGEGAYGRVYGATQPGTERRVAIKVIRPDLADSTAFIRRFEAEARLVARLEHPHIVPLYDYWREPGGAYLVFRFLGGGTARDSVISGGAWSLPRVSQLVEEVGGALIAAHAAGVWHNDVKSSNVMLDDRGSAYLTDFGIADVSAPDDATGDVRGFGWTLWELLTGQPPGQRSTAPSLVGQVAGVPEGLDAVLSKATDSEGGYGSVAELVLGWRAAVGRPEGVLSPVTSGERRAVDSARRAAARELNEAAAAGVNPYKGLRPFDEADAAEFFGRDAVCDELESAVESRRLVTVVGASGSGKSSLVRAGLIPRLRASSHTVVTMVPGDDPIGALRQALSEVASRRGKTHDVAALVGHVVATSGRLVVVVDQLEECWTRTDRARCDEFVDLLARLVEDGPDLRFVATIRADVFDRPLQEPRLGEQAGVGAFVLASLSPAQLGDAITLPAARAGVTVDEAVVAELVTDAASQPGSLPLLQFTLAELYDRRVDGRIGEAALTAVGGMAGSIGRRAEEVYLSVDEPARADTRELFSRLVAPGDGSPDARRRARLSELSAGGRTIADAYVAARLLVTDRDQATREPTVEVAHDALLTRWPRLAGWIDADGRWLTQLQHLTNSARSWDERDRPTADLYRGARLEAAIEAIDNDGRTVSDVERQFVEAGRHARDGELRAAHRSARRLRRSLVAVAAALAAALAGGLIAVDQRSDAQRERRVAFARELASASVANLADDPERSILLALAAVDETRSRGEAVLPEAEEALHRAVTMSRIVLSVPDVGGLLDWSSDGDIFVTEGPEDTGLVDIRSAETGESVLSFHGHDVDINDVAFSADGSMLATAGDDGAARVWDPRTGEELWSVHGDGPVSRPSFSADGTRLLVTWFNESVVRLVDLTTGDVVRERELPPFGAHAALSPDGQRVVTDWGVRDALSGDEILALEGQSTWSDPYVWSPDGKWIAAAIDGTSRIQVWDASTGERHVTIDSGHVPAFLDWSPDSTRLATSSQSGIATVWEIDDGSAREAFRFAAQDLRNGAGGVAFSPDGARLMVGDGAITSVKIFDLTFGGGAEWVNVPTSLYAGKASFTADGRGLLTNSEDGAFTRWDAERGDRTGLFGAGRPAVHLDVSPDGGLVASSTEYHLPVSLWDAATGRYVTSALSDGPDNGVWDLAWSPDGTHLAIIHGSWEERELAIVDRTGELVTSLRPRDPGVAFASVSFSADGRLVATSQYGFARPNPAIEYISVWDWARGEVVRTIDTRAFLVAFDPTGDRLVSGSAQGGDLNVWDAETGERLTTLAGHTGVVRDVRFSSDGSKVATASDDGTARVWDPETGSPLHVLRGHDTNVHSVAFSPDGSRLVSVDDDGLARVWALDLDDLIAIAHQHLTRELTDDECRQYMHLERCPESPSTG